MFPESDRAMGPPISNNAKNVTWRIATDLCLRTNSLETRLQAVEKMPSEGRGRTVQFVPYRFEFTNKLTKNDKLSLAFDALVLSEAMGCNVSFGKIMHGDGHATFKVKLSSLVSRCKRDHGPHRTLGRQFAARPCTEPALRPVRISSALPYSRQRRRTSSACYPGCRRRNARSYTARASSRLPSCHTHFVRVDAAGNCDDKQEKFHHSLRALAIREKKIHAVDLLDPQLDGTPVYLDVEGLPDRDFYYLIGIRVGTGDDAVQYAFWADDENGEKRIWNEFLDVISAIPDPRLIHFGSYETIFLKRMSKRYGGPRESSTASTAIEHAVNLLSFVFAHIYFPTVLQRIEGDRWVSRFPVVGLTGVWDSKRSSGGIVGRLQGTCAKSRRSSTTTERTAKPLHSWPIG